MAALGAAILSGGLKLFGRMGKGKFGFDEDDNITCLRHGEREEVPLPKIIEAGGFECINIERGQLLRITSWWTVGGREQPKEGWEYINLSVDTICPDAAISP